MQRNSSKLVALGTLGVMMASTLGGMSTPAYSKGWIRRHKLATAAIVGGALWYHHHKKKQQQRRHYVRHVR
ncbi:MAG: hypothetical protein JO316_10700 [Abitibacteriaceae bacterium]|nr:hypothetical protein [Abditibacteriaceae bacterium]MBV9865812.1 hypothetical protein [Abditibacteriaceae bacterium]